MSSAMDVKCPVRAVAVIMDVICNVYRLYLGIVLKALGCNESEVLVSACEQQFLV